jgi:predicted metal-dependent peptidase
MTVKSSTSTGFPVKEKMTPEEEAEIRVQADAFKLDDHLVKLLLHEPFFSSLLRNVSKKKTYGISTAGVTAEDTVLTLYWNPIFVMGLESKRIRGLLKHECYHLIFKHCTSRKQDPHSLWNVATDLAINSIIDESELPEKGLIPGKPFDLSEITDQKTYDRWKKLSDLVESLEKGLSSEEYMKALLENPDATEALDSQEGSPTFMDDHDGWGEMSDEERIVTEAKIKDAISDAVKECDRNGRWGTVSSEMRKTLRSMVSDAIDWKKVIHSFCGRSQRSNKSSTHRRVNRKYPYIHPGVRRAHTATVAVYMDQSGSVGNDDVEIFFACLNRLGKMTTFLLYPFDWTVKDDAMVKWKKNQKFPPVRELAGGTSFDAVEKHVKKNLSSFDGHIILTDGGASDPGPSLQRRCWVLLPGCKLPFAPHRNDIVVTMEN